MKKYAFKLLILGCCLSLFACNNDSAAVADRAPIDRSIENANPTKTSTDTGFFESYESTNRGIWQKPALILETLGDLSDKVVADIGAGTGYLTLQIVPKAKKVIAIDIDPRFINLLDSMRMNELEAPLRERLESRLAQPDNPNLQPNEVDVVTIVNTYMYIQDRIDYLQTLQQGMAENSRLLIIDFKKKNTSIGPPSDIRIPLYQVEQELKEAGFTDIKTNDTALNYQYIIIAKRS